MQWDVAVDHTHQSRAEAQRRLSVQRKLAFLVFQGKKSFSDSVPAHLTWISIFSGALTKHCIGIRKIHSNIGFSWLPWRLFQIKSLFSWFLGWFFPSSRQGLLHLIFPQGKGEQERLRGWTQRGGDLGTPKAQLQTRCGLRERKEQCLNWTCPLAELWEAQQRECSGTAGFLCTQRKPHLDSLQDQLHLELCYLMCQQGQSDIIK